MESNFNTLLDKAQRTVMMIGKYNVVNRYFPLANSDNVFGFDVNLLCDEPDEIAKKYYEFKEQYIEENKYTCMVNYQSSDMLPMEFDPYSMNLRDQQDIFEDYYANQYIIFSPIYKYSTNNEVYHKNVRILDVVNVPVVLKPDTNFKVIPKVALDIRVFERKLLNGEYFTLDYAGDVYGDTLDYIICDQYLYFSNSWKYNEKDVLSWKYQDFEQGMLQKVKIDQTSRMINCSKSMIDVVFVDESYIQELREKSESLFECKEEETQLTHEQQQGTLEDVRNTDELKMLESFKQNVVKNSLCYDYEDLINLHICAKSSPLTILAGMSGTGKTQLAYQYAQMIDATETNKTLLFLPISPAFTEPDDVLGYINPTTNRYVPSATGLVDFLIRAQNNPNKIHMVLFDEMNLAQIEYWFAPFIALLEKDVDNRYLPLYNEQCDCENKAQYPSQIKINNNVIFIGTINLDETTKDISDRVLDRVFVINLKKKKFIDYSKQAQSVVKVPLMICESSIVYDQWKSKKDAIDAFSERELLFLDELHDMISKYDEQKGVSFRVLKKIGTYMNNIPRTIHNQCVIEKTKAFDLVLKQTIMKKLSGSDQRLSSLVGRVNAIGEEPSNSQIIDLFTAYSDVSDFEECKACLKRKAEDLLTYGYTR